jgi:hypothetical protein
MPWDPANGFTMVMFFSRFLLLGKVERQSFRCFMEQFKWKYILEDDADEDLKEEDDGRRRHDVALPPPPQPRRCCQRAATVALCAATAAPPPSCRLLRTEYFGTYF